MHCCELILRADATKEEWAKTRMQGIGGSDAGTIIGLNRWKSPITLWAEKTGRIIPTDLSANMAVEAGTRLEPVVAQWFSDVTGKKVQRRGTLRSRSHPFMLANVDRWIPGERVGLEIKTTNAFSADKWDGDEVPDSYYVQCLHYMAVTGAEAWYIAVLIGGQDFRWKKIPRIEDDINILEAKEEKFWEYVKSDTMPPEIDSSKSTALALSRMFKGGRDPVELPAFAGDILDRYDALSEKKKLLDMQIQRCKNELMGLMQNAETETATVNGRKVTWKMGNPRETVSLTEIKKKDPASYEALKAAGLVKVSEPSRTFRIW